MGEFLNKLIRAKYKGITFFVRRETILNIGQKQVIHDYPGSSARYVESQGRSPLEFTAEIFFSGSNFQNNYLRFKTVIQDPTPGRLEIPTFGVFENIVAFPAQAISDQTTLGEIGITITFTETIEKPAPLEILDTEETVASIANTTRKSLQVVFAENYDPPTTRNNIIVAAQDNKNAAEEINKITGAFRTYQRFIRKVDRQIQSFIGLASLLLNQGQPIGFLQSIALSITGLEAFDIFRRIATVGNNQSNSMNDINNNIIPIESTVVPDTVENTQIDFSINLWDNDTVERQQRNNNRLSVINTFRIIGLIGMYEQAAVRNYTTTEQIDQTLNILNEYYIELIENNSETVVIKEIKQELDNVKNSSENVLKEKRQNAFNIIEIIIKKYTPVSLLVYNLYGEYIKTFQEFNFLIELLTGLNVQQPAHKFTGTIKAVEIGRG